MHLKAAAFLFPTIVPGKQTVNRDLKEVPVNLPLVPAPLQHQ